MGGWEIIVLFCAATVSGAINAVAGGGTFITFPILLFTGVPPIPANATNTMALWPGSVASIGAYRQELSATRDKIFPLSIISLLGGLAGALILLKTPERVFANMIPYLLLIATLLFTFGKRLTAFVHARVPHNGAPSPLRRALSFVAQLGIAIYGGYFGAGIGILMLALLDFMGLKNIHEMNGLKTVLASVINGITVATFAIAGVIYWPQALLMMSGAIIGGYGGAAVAKRLPERVVRGIVIAIAGSITAYFFLRG